MTDTNNGDLFAQHIELNKRLWSSYHFLLSIAWPPKLRNSDVAETLHSI